MNHADDVTLLRYRYDSLEEQEKALVADHLRTCTDCGARYAAISKSVEKLSGWDAESELSAPLVEEAMKLVRAKAVAGPPLPSSASPAAPAPSAAAREPEPAFEPEPEPEPRPVFPGLLAWLGVQDGPSMTLRFAATALFAVGLLSLGGGHAYWALKQPRLDTRVSGPDAMIAGDRALVRVEVSDGRDGKALNGADVEVTLIGGTKRWPLFTGRTDATGSALASLELPPDNLGPASLEIITRHRGETDTVVRAVTVKRETRLHLSTDKPLYQPGQTIQIRALALRLPTLAPATGDKLTLEVLDPKGNSLGKKELELGKFGIGGWSFELADGIALGSYRVRATLGATVQEQAVEVARYTLPKFAITLTPERDGYLAGETMQVRVLARTFFGKAVAHAKIQALLVQENSQVAAQAKPATTSADGEAVIELELPASLGAPGVPEGVQIQVEVTDTAGQLQRKQLATVVGRELLSVELLAPHGVLAPGLANELFVLTTTPDGRPVAAEVELRMNGELSTIRTGANGVGVVESPVVPAQGPFKADLTVSDASGRRAYRGVSLPVGGTALTVSTDRALYGPGDTVEVKVRAGSGWGAALELELWREGRAVAVHPLTAGDLTGSVRLPLPPGATGPLEVVVATRPQGPLPAEVDEPELYQPDFNRKNVGARVRRPMVAVATAQHTSRRIVVADPKGVSVTMTADQPEFRPGATAKLRFVLKDAAGKPKPGALGVAVVDESVFALSSARPTLTRAFFLLGAELNAAKGPVSASELTGLTEWSAADQLAGKLLFAGSVEPAAAPAFDERTFPHKVAAVAHGYRNFHEFAVLGWLLWGALALLFLVVALSRYLSTWVGGALLLALGVAGLFANVPANAVAVLLLGAMLVSLISHGVLSRKMGWGLLFLPLLLVSVALWQSVFVRSYSPMYAAEDRSMAAPSVGMMKAEGGAPPAMMNRAPAAPSPARFADEGMMGKKDAPHAAGAKPTEAEPPRREVRVRQYFPETLFVQPELVTDEQGVASLEVPLADSITSWRVTALASTADGKLGTLEEPLKVFQDFFVDLDVPVALVKGDTATVPIAIHNYLSEAQTVRLEVESGDWFEVLGPKTFKLSLGAGELGGQDLRIRVTTAGRHALKVRADGTRLSDVVARELRVFDAGEERSAVVSGTLTPGKANLISLTLPDSAQPGSARLTAKFFGSRVASALDGLEGALQAPHGCFEQTSSTTYPNVLIWSHLEQTGRKDSPAIVRAKNFVGLGYQRLLSFEVPGGGFEWFGRAPANRILTAYGLLEFKDMSKVFPVDPKVISRTQDFLLSLQSSDGTWEPDRANLSDGLYRSAFAGRVAVTAYLGWALAESGFRGPPLDRAAAFLARNADQTEDPYTLALITATLARAGHPQTAAVAKRLAAMAQRDGDKASFNPTGATVYYSRGAGASVEATALAAQALDAAKTEPGLVRGALAWLAANRDARGTWHSTQGTVLALRAILQGASQETDQAVAVRVNGGDALSAKVVASSDAPASVDLGAKLKAGANVIELTGTAEAPFQVVLTWVQPWREKGSDEREALSFHVDFGRTKAKVGDIVPVNLKVTYRQPEASGMVVASLGVPAGLTPLLEDLEALKADGRIARYELDAGVVNLYFDRVTSGTPVELGLRFKATARVQTKGQGSLAYLYYHPEVRAPVGATGVVID